MLDMAKKLIAPAALEYTKIMCDSVVSKENAGIDSSLEKSLANKLSGLTASLYEAIDTLDSKRIASKDHEIQLNHWLGIIEMKYLQICRICVLLLMSLK